MKNFIIYQMSDNNNETLRHIKFLPYSLIKKSGIILNYQMYEPIYIGEINSIKTETNDIIELAEAVYGKFNIDIPEDFKGHSLSVSDVIVIHGRAFYVDSIGFIELEDFYNG